jgi:general secretion pathway protein C
MNRYVIWATNAGLFGLCCFLLAGVIAEVSAAHLAPESATAVEAAAAERPRRVRPDRSQIVARNLFNSAELAAAPEPEPEVEEELQETKLPLRLLGTAASEDESLAWAAIDDLEERKHKVVATGGEVRPGASVVRIDRRRVVLRNAGRLEELTLDDEETPRQVQARRPTRPSRTRAALRTRNESLASRVRKVAENRFEVDDDDVREAARNPASLFSQARILPRYEEGQMIGVQLNAIKEGSLFETVGLQDGDTIVEFNGQSLGSPADSAQLLQQLIDGSSFDVLVEDEAGNERTLTFEATQ